MKTAALFLTLSVFLMLSPAVSALQPGDPAPSFSLRDSQGKPFFLSDRVGKEKRGAGKGLILNFFASTCRPCRNELPVLNGLVEEFRGKGIEVVLIGYGEDFDRFLDLLAELRVDKPFILADRYGKVGERYGVRFLPMTFFISSQGRITDIVRGEMPHLEAALRQRAAELVREKK